MTATEPPVYLINRTGYHGSLPPFNDPTEHAWVKIIEQNWESIRDEIYANVGFRAMNAPHNSMKEGWKGVYLLNFLWTKHSTCRQFPLTIKLLQQVPNLTFAAFSLLEPGASLAPHWGDTNTIMRCALGIEVPAAAPACALKVADEVKSWEEGKIIMFNECHLHEAWNYTDKRRIVFTFDAMRPEYAGKKNLICARVLAAETLFFLQMSFTWARKPLEYAYSFLYFIFSLAWYLYLPVQRRVRFLP